MWRCVACNVTHHDVWKERIACIFNALYAVTIYQLEEQNMIQDMNVMNTAAESDISLGCLSFILNINSLCTNHEGV